jgi:hypothetical protein
VILDRAVGWAGFIKPNIGYCANRRWANDEPVCPTYCAGLPLKNCLYATLEVLRARTQSRSFGSPMMWV